MSLRVLVFDLDDTLLDERPGRVAGRAAMEEVLLDHGLELPKLGFAAAYDRAREVFWQDEANHRRGRLDLVAARAEILRESLAACGHEDAGVALRAARRYFDAATAAQTLMPGALDVLEDARVRFDRLALLTNGAEDAQSEKVRRFDLLRWFDHVQIEGAFGLGKPDPAAFRHAVGAVSARPEEAMMVGNDYQHDVLGALAAGLAATWVDLEGHGEPTEPPGGLYGTIANIRQLPELLGR